MFVPHINDFSPEEVSAIWYSKKEYKKFKKEIQFTLDLAREGKLMGQHRYSDRGLEHVIYRKVGTLRRLRRERSVDTVILEQRDQRREGTFSPEFIAELYQDVSAKSQLDAQKLALKDATDALSYLQENVTLSKLVKTQGVRKLI